MFLTRSAPGRGRRLVRVTLLTFALVGLTQCRLVPERLTGIEAQTFRREARTCLQQCQSDFVAAIQTETRRHFNELRDCSGNQSCIAEEKERFAAAIERIHQERRDCLAGCHHQGGGTGGG